MSYVVKFIQTNPKKIIINDKQYRPYQYGGIIPFFCQELPEEIELIFKDGLTDDERKKVSWFVDNVIEIDRRCKLILEVFKGKDLVLRKYF